MKRTGFTLIEVIVALSLVLIGGLAALRLMARTEHAVSIAREKFVALQVAREGVELVRALRDTAWLNQASPDDSKIWADSVCADTHDKRSFTLDAKKVRLAISEHSLTVGDVEQPMLYIQPNNEWTHEVTDTPSGFSRTITVDCSDKDTEENSFITVTSTVRWALDGIDRSVDIREKLFNWYIPPKV